MRDKMVYTLNNRVRIDNQNKIIARNVTVTTLRQQKVGLGFRSARGFSAGGTSPFATPSTSNAIDKFSFSSDGNASDVGDLTVNRNRPSGQSSSSHGYTSGGNDGTTYYNTIDKFNFSSDGNATDVGDIVGLKGGLAGQSSSINGYSSGGFVNPGATNTIDRF